MACSVAFRARSSHLLLISSSSSLIEIMQSPPREKSRVQVDWPSLIHDGFPAYEVWIENALVYGYDPREASTRGLPQSAGRPRSFMAGQRPRWGSAEDRRG